jgi:hypothetical protein
MRTLTINAPVQRRRNNTKDKRSQSDSEVFTFSPEASFESPICPETTAGIAAALGKLKGSIKCCGSKIRVFLQISRTKPLLW